MGLVCIRGRERNIPRPSWPIAYDDTPLKHKSEGRGLEPASRENKQVTELQQKQPLTTNWIISESIGSGKRDRSGKDTPSGVDMFRNSELRPERYYARGWA
jgi:hypothetical protein